mgnify:CR=1 FL=1
MSGGLNKAKNEEKRRGEFEGTPPYNFINKMSIYFSDWDERQEIIDRQEAIMKKEEDQPSAIDLLWLKKPDSYFKDININLNEIIDKCIAAESKVVLTDSDSKLNELKTLLEDYLQYGSSDGNNKRIELRKQLKKFIE